MTRIRLLHISLTCLLVAIVSFNILIAVLGGIWVALAAAAVFMIGTSPFAAIIKYRDKSFDNDDMQKVKSDFKKALKGERE
jgi:hypothetical protein